MDYSRNDCKGCIDFISGDCQRTTQGIMYCKDKKIQALKKRIEELENLWRSVEDELPEKSGRYICCDEPYSSSVGESIVGYYENGKFYTEIAEDWTNTTHWMPLPKPPSQKGE